VLPKKQKLTKGDFSLLGKNGKNFHSPHLTLRVYRASEGIENKYSFVVSKKVSTKSTQRNALKRCGYRVIGKVLGGARKGFSCVFFFKKTPEDGRFSEPVIQKEIIGLLQEAQVL